MKRLTIAAIALFGALASAGAGGETGPPPADLVNEPEPSLIAARARGSALEILAPGISYSLAALPEYGLRIHAWAFDPSACRFRVVEQKAPEGSRIAEFLDRPDDVFAINGGFFERDRHKRLTPSGLLIVDGRTIAPEHERAGSGIAYADAAGVAIAYRTAAPDKSAMRSAIQVGPILVDPGGKVGIYSNQHDRLNRSALCLRPGKVVFVAVEGGLSLFQFARFLADRLEDGGLGCDTAINLDGGPSTQALFRAGRRRMEIPGAWPVQNALVVSGPSE